MGERRPEVMLLASKILTILDQTDRLPGTS